MERTQWWGLLAVGLGLVVLVAAGWLLLSGSTFWQPILGVLIGLAAVVGGLVGLVGRRRR